MEPAANNCEGESITGMSRRDCPERANQLALAILLVVGKMLGFGFAVALWPGPVRPASSVSVATHEGASSETVSANRVPAETVSPKRVEVPSFEETVPANDDETQLDLMPDLGMLEGPEKVQRTSAKDGTRDLGRVRRVRAVEQFIAEEMVRSTTRHGVTADNFHQRYAAWAEKTCRTARCLRRTSD